MADVPDPARVVADADVLTADLLVGGAARDALDIVRAHSWIELIVSEQLLSDAEAVIAELSSQELAADWRTRIEADATLIEPSAGGHPAVVAAAAGSAASVLSFDERLGSARAGVALRPSVATSVKSPDAFVRLVDPDDLYEMLMGEGYPGPDRDPRG